MSNFLTESMVYFSWLDEGNKKISNGDISTVVFLQCPYSLIAVTQNNWDT